MIRTAHHTFLEIRHPEVTKNPYMFCPRRESKKLSAHGLPLKVVYICEQKKVLKSFL